MRRQQVVQPQRQQIVSPRTEHGQHRGVGVEQAVLAEFLSANALLEIAGSVSAGIAHAGTAYRQGVSEGWQAYWQACKSWLPLLTELDGQPGFQNPVRSGWRGFRHGALAEQRPEVLVISPLVRALKLYVALIGGRTRPL